MLKEIYLGNMFVNESNEDTNDFKKNEDSKD